MVGLSNVGCLLCYDFGCNGCASGSEFWKISLCATFLPSHSAGRQWSSTHVMGHSCCPRDDHWAGMVVWCVGGNSATWDTEPGPWARSRARGTPHARPPRRSPGRMYLR